MCVCGLNEMQICCFSEPFVVTVNGDAVILGHDFVAVPFESLYDHALLLAFQPGEI